MTVFAHSKKNCPRETWQSLDVHNLAVAKMASEFAGSFHSETWAYLLGVVHDAGKARKSFQDYLCVANGMDDVEYDGSNRSHSGTGAVWLDKAEPRGHIGRMIAYCIAGHHAGLADWIGGLEPNGALSLRLQSEAPVLKEAAVAQWVRNHEIEWKDSLVKLAPPWRFCEEDVSFWIRMLYSCLTDADFLDTEAFMNPDQASVRSQYSDLANLSSRFFEHLHKMERSASKSNVNAIRAEVRSACEKAADLDPGLFSLTVPTGGGKTLSGMAFALRHAMKHGLHRVIYVIPYTSIIEQTADTLRGILGPENVLEHHSNFDPDKETQASRLASENWDAPVIVTTSVQFFESLYANKSSRCRKLHNIAKSVVILDEAQLLPPHLLLPCVEALRQLTSHYGVSIVLSTATQPALPGLSGVREIIPSKLHLYERLKRTEIILPDNLSVRRTWEDLADELKCQKQVLCVVNTRRDCRELHKLLTQGTIHLSANMCGEHRSRVIAAIKAMLRAGLPVRVISTQLVEAGVDIDFPVVYRAFTGLASIAQSAGRCNREGLLEAKGRVVVFMPPKPGPCGDLRKSEDVLLGLLGENKAFDSSAPENLTRFFENFYAAKNDLGSIFYDWLKKDACVGQFQFREAANAFKIIDDKTSITVVVRYGGNDSLIDSLRVVGPKRSIMRRLQRYVINVPRGALPNLLERGFVEEMHPGIFVQTMPSLYDDTFGFDWYKENLPCEDLIY